MPGSKIFYKSCRKVIAWQRERTIAQIVGLLGLSGIIYIYLYRDVTHSSNNFTVDKTKYTPTNFDSFSKNIQVNKSVDNDRSNLITTEYKFLITETKINFLFRKEHRTSLPMTCERLLNDDLKAQDAAERHMVEKSRQSIDNLTYRQITTNCSNFILKRGYVDSPVTEMERGFPLAFSIIAYKQVEQIERLLRAIYRPQNFYCIHLDNKTLDDDVITMTSIADCFPNVFMSSRSIDVRWGKFSVLEAELICMEDLWKKRGWKYFINLTGQEFPLKTNLEIVLILKSLKGANIVDGTWVRAREKFLRRWKKPGKLPPHRIFPIKGSVHVCVNRDFVDFALHDDRSKDFLEWLKQTRIPDETFFPSLNHNPHLKIPGSFLGEPEEYPQKPTFTRYKNWKTGHGVWARSCSGKYVHHICILGIGDLPRLKDDISLFANKFYIDYQYMAYECMEEFIYQKTKDQYLNKRHIDVSFYEMLDQVKLRYIKPGIHD